MKQHEKLTLPEKELTPLARVSGINKVVIYMIIYEFLNIADENRITLLRVFNMDETSHRFILRPYKFIPKKAKSCWSHLIVRTKT
jgi:hypothetical protein